ncbi:MAG TPA: hypothetical protein VLL48_07660, partial [Longimicrobiales bacterium]|nr:hypothetical protein [Longimicrobiales bacterium]
SAHLLPPGPAAGPTALSAAPPPPAPPDTLTDLRALLDTGAVLQDRNGDGVVDFLAGRILVGPSASEAEVVAAANVAARLGFETSASDLALLGRAGSRQVQADPVVLVGTGAVDAQGVPVDGRDLTRGLAPGEGALVHLPAGGGLESGGVAVVGYDATGLLAGAAYLSGRYPSVWGVEGTVWVDAVAGVEAFVEAAGLEGAVVLDRIVVAHGEPGVARARVTVRATDAAAFERLIDAFRGAAPDSAASGEEAAPAPDTAAPRIDTAAAAPGDTAGAPPAGAGAEGAGDADQAGQDVPDSPADLVPRDVHRLDVRVVGPDGSRTVPLLPPESWETRGDAASPAGPDVDFSLADVYSVGGLYRDTNRDLVPDETAAYLSVSGADAPGPLADLATRIGLETAGVRLPLARVAGQEDDPEAEGFPVLIGTDHYRIRRLGAEGELAGRVAIVGEEGTGEPGAGGPPGASGASGRAGEGFVQLVDGVFGRGEADERRNGMVVGGADADGLAAALDWLARRAPWLWTHGKGEFRLADAATQVRRFFQVREAPGQLALALAKLGAWMDRRVEAGDPPARVEVELAALEAPEGLDELARTVVRERFPDADVTVRTWPTGFGVGDTVFVQEWELPWEVDEVRGVLRREVYPEVDGATPLRVEVRVSEPPEVRQALAAEIRAALEERGAADPEVVVLNAYKQGYSWIVDHVLPRLRGTPVGSIDVTYHTLEESEEIRWQTIAAETR